VTSPDQFLQGAARYLRNGAPLPEGDADLWIKSAIACRDKATNEVLTYALGKIALERFNRTKDTLVNPAKYPELLEYDAVYYALFNEQCKIMTDMGRILDSLGLGLSGLRS